MRRDDGDRCEKPGHDSAALRQAVQVADQNCPRLSPGEETETRSGGLLLAMRKSGATPEDTFHVGDQPEDTDASRAAGVTAIGAGWGLADTSLLEASKPDHLFVSVQDLQMFFRETL